MKEINPPHEPPSVLQVLGLRAFDPGKSGLSSPEVQANWRAATESLIVNAEVIREAADLSQIFLFIGDRYEIDSHRGWLTVPWNFASDDLPTQMKVLLGSTGGENGVPRGQQASPASAARRSQSQQGPKMVDRLLGRSSAAAASTTPLPPADPTASSSRGGLGGQGKVIVGAAPVSATPSPDDPAAAGNSGGLGGPGEVLDGATPAPATPLPADPAAAASSSEGLGGGWKVLVGAAAALFSLIILAR